MNLKYYIGQFLKMSKYVRGILSFWRFSVNSDSFKMGTDIKTKLFLLKFDFSKPKLPN